MSRMTSSRRRTRLPVCVATLSLVLLTSPGTGQAQTSDITSSGLDTRVTTSGSLGLPAPNWAAARLGLDFVSVDDSTLFRFQSACRS